MKKTNILFVLSDQQSFDMLGCAGNPQIQTPNLDAFNDPFLSYKRLIETVGDQEMPPPIERITLAKE